MKTELSTTIIRASPRLFENVARRAWVEERPGRNATGYLTRAIDVGRFALREGYTGNTCLHFDAFLENVLKRPAAARGDAACKLFGFGRQGTWRGQEISVSIVVTLDR
jgi:hypothetical protein